MMYPSKHLHRLDSDITKVTEGIIIHGCNAQGVMGSGVAKQLRAKYPDIYLDYLNGLEDCHPKAKLGAVFLSKVSGKLLVGNCITQEFYGRDGRKYVSYDALDLAASFVGHFAKTQGETIHVPWLIGAGLGGGNLDICHQILESNFKDNTVVYHHWK